MTEKYAVFQNGGKQYRVNIGQKVKLELIEEKEGATVKLDPVLMIGEGEQVEIGTPSIENASVDVEVLAHGRHDKIEIIKFKRRKHYMKRAGHRQGFTEVKIVGINH